MNLELEGKFFLVMLMKASTFLREEIVNLENVDSSDCYLLSNAKCLSEGVDIPTLDGIDL